MDKIIYNIDSYDRNKTSFPNSHDFTYNKVDTTIDGVVRVEPFNVKNIIEINVENIELPNNFHFINSTKGNNVFLAQTVNPPSTVRTLTSGSYTHDELATKLSTIITGITFSYSSTTGFYTISNASGLNYYFKFESLSNGYQSLGELLGFQADTVLTVNDGNSITSTSGSTIAQEKYVFLKINDLGNIIHKEKRYVSKLVPDNSSRYDSLNTETIYRSYNVNIKFDQPKDINELKISIVDSLGNLASINNVNFSFNFEVNSISNSMLKYYEEMKFYNNDVMERILNARMLEYYDRENKNHTITRQYSRNIQSQFNNIEYKHDGNRNNYNYSE